MGWNASDLKVLGSMILFCALIILLAEVNDRWQRKGFMYGKNGHADCRCAHRGYEHSYRTGVCRFETIVGGLVLRCPCAEFHEAWTTEELPA